MINLRPKTKAGRRALAAYREAHRRWRELGGHKFDRSVPITVRDLQWRWWERKRQASEVLHREVGCAAADGFLILASAEQIVAEGYASDPIDALLRITKPTECSVCDKPFEAEDEPLVDDDGEALCAECAYERAEPVPVSSERIEQIVRIATSGLPAELNPLLMCRDCKLQRYARLAPACVNHLDCLLAGFGHWSGTMKELEDAIDRAMWPEDEVSHG